MAALDIDQTIEQFYQAASEFRKGNPEPMLKMWSQREDVSLANPYGPTVRGWKNVVETSQRAASLYQEGDPQDYEMIVKVVTPDLAFIVENERGRAKVGGSQDFSTIRLRATVIFRKEDGVWKIVHRHADPIVSNQPAESVIQK